MAKITDLFGKETAAAYHARSGEAMTLDLKKSGLEPSDLNASADAQAPVPWGQYLRASYSIPYYGRDNKPMAEMWRRRQFVSDKLKQSDAKQIPKYDQPSRAQIGDLALHPYFTPRGLWRSHDLIICEGEKKAAAAQKFLKRPVLGIGGCNSWGITDQDGVRHVHPEILASIVDTRCTTLWVVPDSDVLTNVAVGRAYREFITALSSDLEIHVVQLGMEDKGLDDWLVRLKEGWWKAFVELPSLDAAVLPETQDELIDQYHLVWRSAGGQANPYRKIMEHEGNVVRLLEAHPLYKGRYILNVETQEMLCDGEPLELLTKATEVMLDMQTYRHMPVLSADKVQLGIQMACLRNTIAPFRDSLQRLEWDMKERVGRLFAEDVGVGKDVEDYEYRRRVGFAFLGGLVKRICNPGCDFRMMIVVTGPQRIGKTGMPKVWVPQERIVDFDMDAYEGNARDGAMQLSRAFVYRMDDIDNLNKHEQGKLKSAVSAEKDTYRVPYGKDVQTFKRRGIFYATTNRAEMLPRDATGNTRYAVVEVGKMWNWKELNKWREQYLAEAMYRVFVQGEDPYFDPSEYKEAMAEHMAESPYEDALTEWMEAWLPQAPTVVWRDGTWKMAKLLDIMRALAPSKWDNAYAQRDMTDLLKMRGWAYTGNNGGPYVNKIQQRRVWLFPSK